MLCYYEEGVVPLSRLILQNLSRCVRGAEAFLFEEYFSRKLPP